MLSPHAIEESKLGEPDLTVEEFDLLREKLIA